MPFGGLGVILGDDLVPRLSLTTVQDLREACLRLNKPEAFGLAPELSTGSLQVMAARGDEDDALRLAAVWGPRRRRRVQPP